MPPHHSTRQRHHYPAPAAGGPVPLDGGDQAFLAELLPAALVFLDEAACAERHPVAAPELPRADLRCIAAEADRLGSGAVQGPDDLVITDQRGCRVAGVGPLQVARCDVESHHLCRDEVLGAALPVDGGVHERVRFGEPEHR